MILIIKHAEIEGLGTLGDFFKETAWEIETVELWDNVLLPKLNDCEAIISLGGPMNVYETDRHPFLKMEEDFLRNALRKKVPVLGICLGAQLLAKVAGAEVKKSEQSEIGWYNVELSGAGKDDLLFKGINTTLEVFQWHEDTFEVPPEGVLLATSSLCKNQAFRVGECAWGVQFHPEMTSWMLESWLDASNGQIDKNKLMVSYYKKSQSYNKQARIMYLNFAGVVAKYSPAKI
jgi:GMP synthase-like glutamine amidotransferase